MLRNSGNDYAWVEILTAVIRWKGKFVALVFIGDLTERKQAEMDLRLAQYQLEQQVIERTGNLQQTSEELQVEIAHRQQAEHALSESEERYRALFEQSPDAIAIVLPDGRFVEANDSFLRMFRASRDDLPALNAKSLWADPSDRSRWQRIIDMKGSAKDYECRLRKMDGSLMDAMLTTTLRAVQGGAGEYQTIVRDITMRKQMEMVLRESEERFRTIFESARDCVFIKDTDLRYTHANPSMLELVERDWPNLRGLTDEDLFGAWEGSRLRSQDLRVLDGQELETEQRLSIKGREVTFNSVRIPLCDASGNIVGLCGIARDVTERRTPVENTGAIDSPLKSEAIKSTMHLVRLAAKSDSVVLLLGESGTGKDYLAAYLHGISGRAGGPFFSINCAALAAQLAESELFGHEPGAFTGARGMKRGMLELADEGTLLLNEIGELSVSLQAKLLTFLDTGTFTRVGGEKNVVVNTRVIAATNRDLEKDMVEGRFRKDLFYRLDVLSIVIPPLRQRTEDIPALAEMMLGTLSKKMGIREIPLLDSRSTSLLEAYYWPGNVRELRNVLERALIVSQGRKIVPETLSLTGNTSAKLQGDNWSMTVPFPEDKALRDIVKDVKRQLMTEAIHRSGGVKKKAARMLGMSPDAFKHQAKSLGL
ncbi:sigma 54-interacting transcriptional regulator [Thermodesulfobacteriota bacterium]